MMQIIKLEINLKKYKNFNYNQLNCKQDKMCALI